MHKHTHIYAYIYIYIYIEREPEVEELAKGKEGPEVEGRRPMERRDREEGDELNKLQEVSNVSHNLRRVTTFATEVNP